MQPGRLLVPILTLLFTSEAFLTSEANAVPILQLYVEGATYDHDTESWTYVAPGSSGGAPFRLWAIGNVNGDGGKGTIYNVRLAAAYDIAVGDLDITLVGSTINPVHFSPIWADPSTPDDIFAPILGPDGTGGRVPKLGDGSDLPSHGEYGDGVVWQEFALGDFTLTDSPVADFIGSFPTSQIREKAGQINVYEIAVIKNTSEPVVVHFDLYNSVKAGNNFKYKFAPFSHDAFSDQADADVTIVPEPPSVLLLSVAGCLGAMVWASRRRSGLAATSSDV